MNEYDGSNTLFCGDRIIEHFVLGQAVDTTCSSYNVFSHSSKLENLTLTISVVRPQMSLKRSCAKSFLRKNFNSKVVLIHTWHHSYRIRSSIETDSTFYLVKFPNPFQELLRSGGSQNICHTMANRCQNQRVIHIQFMLKSFTLFFSFFYMMEAFYSKTCRSNSCGVHCIAM